MTRVRHRIHELFSEQTLDMLMEVMDNPVNTSNNMKVEDILKILKPLGFAEIGPGTNRFCVKYGNYVYKIAMDSYGIRDNWNEFNISPLAQPYVTKTYECNGLIAVAEYVNLINKIEFEDSKENIKTMLQILSQDFLFCDLSTNLKNYLNFGFTDDGRIVVLDYGYLYPLDRKIMFCKKCGSKLEWSVNFDVLKCSRCGTQYNPIDVRDRMWKSVDSFTDADFEYDESSNDSSKKKKKKDTGMLRLDLSNMRD